MHSPEATRLLSISILAGLLMANAGYAQNAERAPAERRPSESGRTDPAAIYRAQQEVFRQAAAKVAPCIVTIETVGGTQPPARAIPTTRPAGGRPPRRPPVTPTRSGFIIGDGPTTGLIHSADGLIITSAFNFVRDPSVITVTLADGRRFVGELLARDEVRKLAMLKIDADGLPTPEWVTDEAVLRVGQWTLALGRGFGNVASNPDARQPARDPSLRVHPKTRVGPASSRSAFRVLGCTLSAGIISGLNRMRGLAVQTDARLSPANFGGPLIDLDGRVIGICVPMGVGSSQMAGVEWYDSGVGFVTSYSQVRKSAESLAVGHSIRRGLIGIQEDPKSKHGVRITAIPARSPARRSGIEVGDVIIAIDDKPVDNLGDLRRLMRVRQAGEWVTLRIRRGEKVIEVQLVLGVPDDIGNDDQESG